MSGATAMEHAIQRAVDEKIDFDQFASSLRYATKELKLSSDERDRILLRLAEEIKSWVDLKLKD